MRGYHAPVYTERKVAEVYDQLKSLTNKYDTPDLWFAQVRAALALLVAEQNVTRQIELLNSDMLPAGERTQAPQIWLEVEKALFVILSTKFAEIPQDTDVHLVKLFLHLLSTFSESKYWEGNTLMFVDLKERLSGSHNFSGSEES